ncbi:hypothetical protein DMX12_16935 [Pseudomonas sp. MB-090624]|nr:hypothetical protein DMX12_16935 [Pseudomonas sp. MB-090624]
MFFTYAISWVFLSKRVTVRVSGSNGSTTTGSDGSVGSTGVSGSEGSTGKVGSTGAGLFVNEIEPSARCPPSLASSGSL